MANNHDAAEYYSPPRMLPIARQKGLRGSLSLDLLTRWDFRCRAHRTLAEQLLSALQVMFLLVCPPCTIFSDLMRLWNIRRTRADTFRAKWDEGMLYLNHNLDYCRVQLKQKHWFVFEHPRRASSWKTPEMQEFLKLPDVVLVTFDQCAVGLVSPIHGTPYIRERN